jgi:hypothetical protein
LTLRLAKPGDLGPGPPFSLPDLRICRLAVLDQVLRRREYESAHADVEIIYLGPFWQAILREEEGGQTIITRPSLGKLLDKLESLDQERRPPPPS